MRTWFQELVGDGRAILKGTWQVVRARRLLLIALFAGVLAVAALVYPHDRVFYERMAEDRVEAWIRIANKLRRWGDFRDTVTMTVIVLVAGTLARRRSWRTAATGAFIGACIAGLMVNVVRFTAGRPRPTAGMEDGFYGPTFQYKMQSFPSGHSGTSLAFGTALTVALPGAGWIAFASGAGVVWACLYAKVHYVTDVFVGGCIGLIMGALVGIVTRRVMNETRAQAPPV